MKKHVYYWFGGLLAAQLLFMFAVFPAFEYGFENENLVLLDLRLGYEVMDVKLLFDALDASGRAVYRSMLIYADMPYPFIYGGLLFVSLCLTKPGIASNHVCYAPLIPVLADFSENMLNLILLKSYPELNPAIISFSSLANQVKWYGLIAVVSLLAIFYINKTYLKLRKS